MDSLTPTAAISRHARCQDPRGSLTRLFFSDRTRDVLRAKSICARCTIRELCLLAAIRRGEPCGIWGGEELVDGEIVVGRRRRGRPPKVAPPAPIDLDEITGEPIVA
jgi:WhiB family transcriptional regulator, redox-sensing transcriptional regulator